MRRSFWKDKGVGERREPIRILHLFTELNTGGAEMMLYRLVTRMDRRRFQSFVISMTDRGVIGKRVEEERVPTFCLGMSPGRPNLNGLMKLIRFLRKEPVDIIQTWLYHADLLGLIAGKVVGINKIVWGIRCSDMHLHNYRPLTALTVTIGACLSRFANGIVVNSEKGKAVHRRRGYYTKKMVFIPNGIDTEDFRPEESAKGWLCDQLGLSRDVLIIGLIARFDPMKDHRTFFRAASLLASKDKSAHFVLAGKGVNPDNKGFCALLPDDLPKERVHLLGLREDASRITAALDVATSSSAFGEGFSNTIGEAMSCGVPCVVTDVGDSARIVADTGYVVPPGNPEAMSERWLELLRRGEAYREEMGRKARQRVLENFDLGKTVRDFERFYTELMVNS